MGYYIVKSKMVLFTKGYQIRNFIFAAMEMPLE